MAVLKHISSKSACIFSLFFIFIIYNITISPTVYWRDSPEFVDTAYSIGIAHPAGFPAYSLISKIITFLPISNIAMRVNYVSLFFAVLTLWITFYIIIELIKICFQELPNNQASLAAMLSVLILGSASSFWWMATVAEAYTMNCFFLSGFFLAVIKWLRFGSPKFLMLASFVFGISTSVYGANLLFSPFLFIFYFLKPNENKLHQLFLAVGFFLLGYSIHLYLPLRSLTDPTFDWSNPENIKNFISHITDRKDESAHFERAKNAIAFFYTLVIFGKVLLIEITIMGVILTIVGFICHFKKEIKSFFLFASIGFINTIFLLTSFGHIDNGSVFLVSFMIFSFWIGLGTYFLLEMSSDYIAKFKYKNIIIPVIISFIILSFIKNYPSNNKSDYYLPRDHAREMVVALDQNGMVVSSMYWFFFRYFQDVENLRPDTSVILVSDLIQPERFQKVTPARFPLLSFPPMESSGENRHEFMQAFISSNIRSKPIYWDFKRELTKFNFQYLIPDNKFLMRFVDHKVDKIPEDLAKKYFLNLKNSILKELEDEKFFLDQGAGVRSYYYHFLESFVEYLMMKNLYHHALPFLELALTLFDSEAENFLTLKGVCLMKSGNLNMAEEIFVKLYNKYKKDYGYNFNLASLYYAKGELEKSKRYIESAKSLKKDFAKSYFLAGQIYLLEGNYDQAIIELTYAIEKTKFLPENRKIRKVLARVKKLKAENNGISSSSRQPASAKK